MENRQTGVVLVLVLILTDVRHADTAVNGIASIPVRADCSNTTIGIDYVGTIAQSRDGGQCRRWDQVIAQFGFTNNTFPDLTIADAQNYCRNPRISTIEVPSLLYYRTKPFCFSPNNKEAICDIPFCALSSNYQACYDVNRTQPTTPTTSTTQQRCSCYFNARTQESNLTFIRALYEYWIPVSSVCDNHVGTEILRNQRNDSSVCANDREFAVMALAAVYVPNVKLFFVDDIKAVNYRYKISYTALDNVALLACGNGVPSPAGTSWQLLLNTSNVFDNILFAHSDNASSSTPASATSSPATSGPATWLTPTTGASDTGLTGVTNTGATLSGSISPSAPNSPDLSVTSSPVLSVTSSHVLSVTSSPVLSVTNSPVLSVTNSPVLSVTSSPVLSVTSSPVLSVTNSPDLSVTSSPVLIVTSSTNSLAPSTGTFSASFSTSVSVILLPSSPSTDAGSTTLYSQTQPLSTSATSSVSVSSTPSSGATYTTGTATVVAPTSSSLNSSILIPVTPIVVVTDSRDWKLAVGLGVGLCLLFLLIILLCCFIINFCCCKERRRRRRAKYIVEQSTVGKVNYAFDADEKKNGAVPTIVVTGHDAQPKEAAVVATGASPIDVEISMEKEVTPLYAEIIRRPVPPVPQTSYDVKLNGSVDIIEGDRSTHHPDVLLTLGPNYSRTRPIRMSANGRVRELPRPMIVPPSELTLKRRSTMPRPYRHHTPVHSYSPNYSVVTPSRSRRYLPITNANVRFLATPQRSPVFLVRNRGAPGATMVRGADIPLNMVTIPRSNEPFSFRKRSSESSHNTDRSQF